MSVGALIRLGCGLLAATSLSTVLAAEPDAPADKPQAITRVKPDYPEVVRRANIEGPVVAR